MELDAVRSVQNGVQCFALALVTRLHQLLRHHDDRVLGLLDALCEAVVGYTQVFLGFLLALILQNRCQVLHVDEAAHLIIIQHVEDLNLNKFQLALSIRIGVNHLVGLLELVHRLTAFACNLYIQLALRVWLLVIEEIPMRLVLIFGGLAQLVIEFDDLKKTKCSLGVLGGIVTILTIKLRKLLAAEDSLQQGLFALRFYVDLAAVNVHRVWLLSAQE